jgi:hypothetical protein
MLEYLLFKEKISNVIKYLCTQIIHFVIIYLIIVDILNRNKK